MTTFIFRLLQIREGVVFKRDLAKWENHIVSEIPDSVSIVEVGSPNIEDGENLEVNRFYKNFKISMPMAVMEPARILEALSLAISGWKLITQKCVD